MEQDRKGPECEPKDLARKKPYSPPVVRKLGPIDQVTKGINVTGTDGGVVSA